MIYSEKEIQSNNLSETLYRTATDTLVLVHGPSESYMYYDPDCGLFHLFFKKLFSLLMKM